MKFDSILSTITVAAIAGLVILNFQGSVAILKGASDAVNSYVSAVQGRGGNVGASSAAGALGDAGLTTGTPQSTFAGGFGSLGRFG